MNVILASASPRRKELMKLLYSDFIVCPAKGEEVLPPQVTLEFAPVFLSVLKSDEVSRQFPGDLVIAADTVVVVDGKMLGKPKTKEEAVTMLKTLSGRTHKVVTGCCLQIDERADCFDEETEVTFYPLTDEEILEYVESGEPMDKAGAYAIQGKGALFVKKIDGDFYNVMGLPVAHLKRVIQTFLEHLNDPEFPEDEKEDETDEV